MGNPFLAFALNFKEITAVFDPRKSFKLCFTCLHRPVQAERLIKRSGAYDLLHDGAQEWRGHFLWPYVNGSHGDGRERCG